jgi:hypothetical protein
MKPTILTTGLLILVLMSGCLDDGSEKIQTDICESITSDNISYLCEIKFDGRYHFPYWALCEIQQYSCIPDGARAVYSTPNFDNKTEVLEWINLTFSEKRLRYSIVDNAIIYESQCIYPDYDESLEGKKFGACKEAFLRDITSECNGSVYIATYNALYECVAKNRDMHWFENITFVVKTTKYATYTTDCVYNYLTGHLSFHGCTTSTTGLEPEPIIESKEIIDGLFVEKYCIFQNKTLIKSDMEYPQNLTKLHAMCYYGIGK